MQVRKKMFLLIRSLVQLRRDMCHSLESSKLEVIVKHHYSVGYLAKIIVRRIFHCTREVGLRSICSKNLGMVVIEFLEFMRLWTTSRRITRHLSLI